MVIILEGTDLVGKSTLAKELSRELKIPQTGIWIDLNNPKPAVISVSKTLKQVIKTLKPDIIFDRSFMSEWVYSKVKNREDDYINSLIKEWCEVDNLLIVILHAEDRVLVKRFENRGDKYFSIEDILMANELYKELHDFVKQRIYSILIDVSNLTTEQIVLIIEKALNKREL